MGLLEPITRRLSSLDGAWARLDPWQRRVALWVSLGLVVSCLVLMRDINALLTSIDSSGGRSYGTGVFAGPQLDFLSTTDFEEAMRLWFGEHAADAPRLLRAHAITDLVFVVALLPLTAGLLRKIGVESRTAWITAGAIAVADLAETGCTLFIFGTDTRTPAVLVLARALSLLKWTLALGAVVLALVRWRTRAGEIPLTDRARRAWQNRLRTPVLSLGPQFVLVVVFGILVALPAGGPLEQLPDIIRYQFSEAPWPVVLVSVATITGFAGTIAVSGLIAHRSRLKKSIPVIDTLPVVVGAGAISAGLLLAGWAIDHTFNWAATAPFVVMAGLFVAARLAGWAGIGARPPEPGDLDIDRAADDRRAIVWIGTLSGLVIVIAGIGLVRAASPVLLLRLADDPTRWQVIGGVGLFTALAMGALTQGIVLWLSERYRLHTPGQAWILITAASVVVAVSVVLAIAPLSARHFGSAGVVAVGFSLYAIVIAGLQFATRYWRRWPVTTTLGLGPRTPWGLLFIAVFVVASLLNAQPGYHDVRTRPVEPGDPHRYADIEAAFSAWTDAQNLAGCPDRDEIPLILVAAPGGGVRAAYWTASALETLFPDACAARGLFSMSGVSGGAVGSTLWTAQEASTVDNQSMLEGLSGDQSLAAALAGMFLRDMPQPFTGIRTGWRDRAALFEDGWIENTGVLERNGEPLAWGDLTLGENWTPVMVMNSSSVTDGCRILITNMGRMEASATSDCLANGSADGTSRAAIDPLPVAHDDGCDGQPLAVSAALLAARFPYITPSGSLTHCPETPPPSDRDTTLNEQAADEMADSDADGAATTVPPDASSDEAEPDGEQEVIYGVDGGYFENSGLLTSLELLESLEPLIRAANRGDGPDVVPWIVELDNHYRSTAAAAPASRPLELLVPLITVTRSKLLADTALEQAATVATDPAQWDLPEADCRRFIRIGPLAQPRLEAPLGWVLSEVSRRTLDADLNEAVTTDQCVQELFGIMRTQPTG